MKLKAFGSRKRIKAATKSGFAMLITPERDTVNEQMSDDTSIDGAASLVADPVISEVVASSLGISAVEINSTPQRNVQINSNLFSQTRLYKLTNPIVELLHKNVESVIAIGSNGLEDPNNKWGVERTEMFLDHIFKRVKKLLGISISSSNENSEKDMIDSAVTYMSSLKKIGTNFTGNEYVRIHILESLIPPTVKSSRSLALRLGVNRNTISDIIKKRHEFNEICRSKDQSTHVSETVEDDDSSLDEMANIFSADRTADELGLLHLFADFNFDIEDDFFYVEDTPEVAPIENTKSSKGVNLFHDHLKPKKRKRRKDCPKYLDVVRSYGHSVFRPDTFAKNKKMVLNEDGDYEFHMMHVQNRSIKDTHASFLLSMVYHDWQYLNRWSKLCSDGQLREVLPSICLRLFYYAICPCCKEPSQRDCADSMVVGFSHALIGMGKIRMSEHNNKKNLIRECSCPYHSRESVKELWRNTDDFMAAMLCPPIEFTEFQNPVISHFSTKVSDFEYKCKTCLYKKDMLCKKDM